MSDRPFVVGDEEMRSLDLFFFFFWALIIVREITGCLFSGKKRSLSLS